MPFNKQMLVVIDPQDREYLSLHRGQLIALRLQCAIKVLWLGDDEALPAQLVTQLEAEGISASYQCCPEKDLINTLKQLWQTEGFGLLVKSCDPRQHSFRTSRDARILRELPCPVLLVKHDNSWHNSTVVAAADPFSDDSERQLLNQGVLTLASEIAQQVSGQLHVAVACPSAMLAGDPELQSEELIQQNARKQMEVLLALQNLSAADINVGEGPPEHWVPQVANQHQAALVVIGTQARHGLKGALIGNTAERILHRLDADVLVLRKDASDQVVPVVQNAQ
ncbi:universal stress protein [Amphritea sp. HPY]|uniref:universal stress protein n=1 Tax=Amphritea sp. HPY TaxID=3421652 RepID=UPI003D7D5656